MSDSVTELAGSVDLQAFYQILEQIERRLHTSRLGYKSGLNGNNYRDRHQRATDILANEIVSPTGIEGRWLVGSQSTELIYTVTLGDPPSCQCDDYEYNKGKTGGWCAHALAAARAQDIRNVIR